MIPCFCFYISSFESLAVNRSNSITSPLLLSSCKTKIYVYTKTHFVVRGVTKRLLSSKTQFSSSFLTPLLSRSSPLIFRFYSSARNFLSNDPSFSKRYSAAHPQFNSGTDIYSLTIFLTRPIHLPRLRLGLLQCAQIFHGEILLRRNAL